MPTKTFCLAPVKIVSRIRYFQSRVKIGEWRNQPQPQPTSSTPQLMCNIHPWRRLPPSLHCQYGIPRKSLSQRHGYSPLGCYCESDFRSELHHVHTSRSFDRWSIDDSPQWHRTPPHRHTAVTLPSSTARLPPSSGGHHRLCVNLTNAVRKTPFSAGWFYVLVEGRGIDFRSVEIPPRLSSNPPLHYHPALPAHPH